MNGSGEVRFRYQEITFHYCPVFPCSTGCNAQICAQRSSVPLSSATNLGALHDSTRLHSPTPAFCAFVTDNINVISPDVRHASDEPGLSTEY